MGSVNRFRVLSIIVPHRQLMKFAIVGLLGAFVDYSIYTILTRLASVDYLLARAVSVMLAIFNNFVWNKNWTFERRQSEKTATEYFRFLMVSLLSMGVNLAVMFVIIEYTPAEILFGSYEDVFAMSVSILAAFFLNFYLNKRWTFS